MFVCVFAEPSAYVLTVLRFVEPVRYVSSYNFSAAGVCCFLGDQSVGVCNGFAAVDFSALFGIWVGHGVLEGLFRCNRCFLAFYCCCCCRAASLAPKEGFVSGLETNQKTNKIHNPTQLPQKSTPRHTTKPKENARIKPTEPYCARRPLTETKHNTNAEQPSQGFVGVLGEEVETTQRKEERNCFERGSMRWRLFLSVGDTTVCAKGAGFVFYDVVPTLRLRLCGKQHR